MMDNGSRTIKELQAEIISLRQRITELEEPTQKSQPNDQLYQSLIDTMPYYVYRIDRDGKAIFVNRAVTESLGIPPEQVIGKTVFDFYSEEIASHYYDDDQDVLRTGQPSTKTETLSSLQDSRPIYLRIVRTPIFDELGHVVGIQGIIEDISDAVVAQNEAQSSQASLRRFIQQLPVGIQTFDVNGLCTDVNEAHCEIFGVTKDSLISEYNILKDPLAQTMPTYDAAKRALQGETIQLGDLEFNFAHADARFADAQQKIHMVNVTIFPLFDHDNKVTSIVGLNVDVTERYYREREIQHSEARYRAVVEAQGEYISRYLPDGTLTFANQAFCQFVGLPLAEIIGKTWQSLMSPENLELALGHIQSITFDNPSTSYEEEIVDDSDQSQWIRWINRGIFDNDGEIIEYQGLGIDITAERRYQEQVFQIALEKERIDILGEFIVKAGHEFRTPLSVINSSSYAMARLDDIDQRLERYSKITKQVKRITKLVDSMTLMSHLDRRLIPANQDIFDLNRLLDISCTLLQSKLEQSPRSLKKSLTDDPLIVKITQTDFVRAIETICDNAIQYTVEGDEISISSYKESDTAVVVISDMGLGISADSLPHVFERFFREDNVGKTPGMGLGLPIAKALLRQYNGTIDISSEQGSGTTVTIRLPLSETPSQ